MGYGVTFRSNTPKPKIPNPPTIAISVGSDPPAVGTSGTAIVSSSIVVGNGVMEVEPLATGVGVLVGVRVGVGVLVGVRVGPRAISVPFSSLELGPPTAGVVVRFATEFGALLGVGVNSELSVSVRDFVGDISSILVAV